MKNIFVVYGGISVEHEVSILSAQNVVNGLDRKKFKVYPVYVDKSGRWTCNGECNKKIEDYNELKLFAKGSVGSSLSRFIKDYFHEDQDNVFFPIVHGTYGENGELQGFLEILDVPYVGNSVIASALCMDKAFSNQIYEENNIPQAKFKVLDRLSYKEDLKNKKEILDYLGLPVFVKPCNSGSSIGVTRVLHEEDLEEAVKTALKYDNKILIEEAIIGDELQVSVIGNDDPIASLPGVSRVKQEFYNYESKYFDDSTIHLVPFELEEGETEKVQELAKKVYTLCNCSGFARVDIFLRDSDRKMLVNEINTAPGMTNHSMSTMLWKVTDGTEFPELLEKLIDYAVERYNKDKNLIREI
ncbi:MAG: D-alanine--D-alanine ligase family protein [Lagierella massiliensis]|nr:D-alanine--D-alanine ligase family protein [Lagierella massiliensis]